LFNSGVGVTVKVAAKATVLHGAHCLALFE